jgi:hypothetical protein
MKRLSTTFLLFAALPLAAETWTNVPLVDSNCSAKVKAAPDQHTKQCALSCAKSGFGVLTSDGSFLKFDDTGNTKALAALRSSRKTDHLRATVAGKRDGDRIQVDSIALD